MHRNLGAVGVGGRVGGQGGGGDAGRQGSDAISSCSAPKTKFVDDEMVEAGDKIFDQSAKFRRCLTKGPELLS